VLVPVLDGEEAGLWLVEVLPVPWPFGELGLVAVDNGERVNVGDGEFVGANSHEVAVFLVLGPQEVVRLAVFGDPEGLPFGECWEGISGEAAKGIEEESVESDASSTGN
jgi:hypothetical protein